jgi:hypothetical protein
MDAVLLDKLQAAERRVGQLESCLARLADEYEDDLAAGNPSDLHVMLALALADARLVALSRTRTQDGR